MKGVGLSLSKPALSGAKSKGAGVGSFLHHTSEEGIKKERIWKID